MANDEHASTLWQFSAFDRLHEQAVRNVDRPTVISSTLMAEIAADLQMSPGNLYRYFPGKIDIALAIAEEHGEKQHQQLIEAANEAGLPAVARLRNIFHLDMVLTYEQIESDPRTFELAQGLSWNANGKEGSVINGLGTKRYFQLDRRHTSPNGTYKLLSPALPLSKLNGFKTI